MNNIQKYPKLSFSSTILSAKSISSWFQNDFLSIFKLIDKIVYNSYFCVIWSIYA